MQSSRIELLQQMPVFGAVEAECIEYLLADAPERRVAAGSFFFHEGDPAHAMYVIEAGRVTICKRWQQHQLVLRRLGEGDCFGEMALLDLYPRSASVRADADCRAIELSTANLLRLFERNPAQFAVVQMNIAREMSRRLRITDDLLLRARMGEPLHTLERLDDAASAP